MRKLLRAEVRDKSVSSQRVAHRGFQVSLVVSGLRCIIMYLLIPILVPILNISGAVAAPIGILLCAIAVVSGIISVRRFWISDHKSKWMYTWFIAFVFVVLAIGLFFDINSIVSGQ